MASSGLKWQGGWHEEQLIKRLYNEPLQKDENKIAMIRGEFGLYCVHYLGTKYDQNPSPELMKEVEAKIAEVRAHRLRILAPAMEPDAHPRHVCRICARAVFRG